MGGRPHAEGWRTLLGAKHGGTSFVLAGGVALAATNEFMAMSVMPAVVRDLDGHRLYAWVTTAYLVASVIGATTVGTLLSRLGARHAYLVALAGFGCASLGCAAAPSMPALILGCATQGMAAGILTGLSYAVITTTLPEVLWPRGSALISAMWGLGTLLGPATGGLILQLSNWRFAFVWLAGATCVLAAVVPSALSSRNAVSTITSAVPLRSLMPLGFAALAISVAGLQASLGAMALVGSISIAALALFTRVDRRAANSVLPPSAYARGPIKWIYLTMGALMAATMVDLYVPLLAQTHAGMIPAAAGYLAACPAIGWTVAEIVSATASDQRTVARLLTFGPAITAIGLTVGVIGFSGMFQLPVAIVFLVALLVTGIGVGVAWPHLSAWAMSKVSDTAEGPTAAAAINTVQLISGAYGAGVAGIVTNVNGFGAMTSARWLFLIFGVIAAMAIAASPGTRLEPGMTAPRRVGGRHRVPASQRVGPGLASAGTHVGAPSRSATTNVPADTGSGTSESPRRGEQH